MDSKENIGEALEKNAAGQTVACQLHFSSKSVSFSPRFSSNIQSKQLEK
jgi:hypothetical protein